MHPAIKYFTDYWNQLKSEKGGPYKKDFSITDLPTKMWKYIMVIEVERDPMRFRYSLFGTPLADAYGSDITGRYMDEIDLGGNNERYAAFLVDACDQKKPLYIDDTFIMEDEASHAFEAGLFPFLDEKDQVSHVIFAVYTSRNGVSSVEWRD